MKSTWLVTGGAGFIGSCFVRQLVSSGENNVVNLDLLTYAGNLDSVPPRDSERHVFIHGDINDRLLVDKILEEFRPKGIVHFAAESHVDRSIDGPGKFVQTNVVGTCTLLDAALGYFQRLSPLQGMSSGFCMSRPMKSMARWDLRGALVNPHLTIRVRPTRLRKLRPTCSFEPTTRPMACR